MTTAETEMIAGERVLMHKCTICTVNAPGKAHNGAECSVQAFVAKKRKWRVQLEPNSPDGGGKEVLVAEASLQLVFCLLW